MDGSSWPQAFRDLQAALQHIINNPPANHEIWVAQETYKPTVPSGRLATFRLVNDVALYGGFPQGGGNGLFSARNPALYSTILSGDIGTTSILDNCYHVVTASNTDETAVIDGFTIMGGNANRTATPNPQMNGGGMYIADGSPRIQNCIFRANRAANAGGGIYNERSSPTISQCSFVGNSVSGTGTPVIPTGGGVCNFTSSSPVIVNCVFSGNSADYAGAVRNWSQSNPVLVNCTFAFNNGYGRSIYSNVSSHATVANCILWGNASGQIVNGSGGTAAVSYSIVYGGWSGGTEVLDADPLFVDHDGPDGIIGTEDDNLRLSGGSPAIDSGDNSAVPEGTETDRDGRPRRMDDPATTDTGAGTAPIVDMGAYEYCLRFIVDPGTLSIPKGDTGAFTVKLSGDPGGSLEACVARVSGDEGITVENGSSLFFDSTNYNIPQTVTLASAPDCELTNGQATVEISAWGVMSATVDVEETDSSSELTWVQVADTGPSARKYHAMAYDVDSGKVVLFGGWTAGGDDYETWEWDGGTQTWTQRFPYTSPPAQHGHAMAGLCGLLQWLVPTQTKPGIGRGIAP